jgi:hypothetical protein
MNNIINIIIIINYILLHCITLYYMLYKRKKHISRLREGKRKRKRKVDTGSNSPNVDI